MSLWFCLNCGKLTRRSTDTPACIVCGSATVARCEVCGRKLAPTRCEVQPAPVTPVVPEVHPLFLAGYTRGWDDREARPGDFDVDKAWAAYQRERRGKP